MYSTLIGGKYLQKRCQFDKAEMVHIIKVNLDYSIFNFFSTADVNGNNEDVGSLLRMGDTNIWPLKCYFCISLKYKQNLNFVKEYLFSYLVKLFGCFILCDFWGATLTELFSLGKN